LNVKVNEEIGNAFMAIRGGDTITVNGKESKRIELNGKDLKTYLYDLITSAEYKEFPVGVKSKLLEIATDTFSTFATVELKRMYPEIEREEMD
jgi:hypothetical protein